VGGNGGAPPGRRRPCQETVRGRPPAAPHPTHTPATATSSFLAMGNSVSHCEPSAAEHEAEVRGRGIAPGGTARARPRRGAGCPPFKRGGRLVLGAVRPQAGRRRRRRARIGARAAQPRRGVPPRPAARAALGSRVDAPGDAASGARRPGRVPPPPTSPFSAPAGQHAPRGGRGPRRRRHRHHGRHLAPRLPLPRHQPVAALLHKVQRVSPLRRAKGRGGGRV